MNNNYQIWLFFFTAWICACDSKPPTSPPSRETFKVRFPRNDLTCNETSKSQAKRWVQQMPIVTFEQSLGRRSLAAVPGEKLLKVPRNVFTLTKKELFLNEKKLLDLPNLTPSFRRLLWGAMKKQGLLKRNNYTLAVTKDASVLAFWQFISLLPTHAKTISFLHVSPKVNQLIEPPPSFVRERFKMSLGALPEDNIGNSAKRIKTQQDHFKKLLQKAASQCGKSPESFASLVSPQDVLDGVALVDAWFACECAFDIEMFFMGVYGQRLKDPIVNITTLSLPIHSTAAHHVSFKSIEKQTWSQFAPTLLGKTDQGMCLDKVPDDWCKTGSDFLCHGSCPKSSTNVLNKIDTGAKHSTKEKK